MVWGGGDCSRLKAEHVMESSSKLSSTPYSLLF